MCLEVEIAEHGIAAPPAEQLDDVGINLTAEEGHGAGGTEGTGRNGLGRQVELGQGGGSGAKVGGYVGRGEVGPPILVAVGAKQFGGVCMFGVKVVDATGEGANGVGVKGGVGIVADDFATDCIFLGGESKGGEIGTEEVVQRRGVRDDAIGRAKFDVTKAKRGGVFGSRARIFARSKEEEEGDPDHVGEAFGFLGIFVAG